MRLCKKFNFQFLPDSKTLFCHLIFCLCPVWTYSGKVPKPRHDDLWWVDYLCWWKDISITWIWDVITTMTHFVLVLAPEMQRSMKSVSHNHGAIWTHLAAVEAQSVSTHLPDTHLVLKREVVSCYHDWSEPFSPFSTHSYKTDDARWVKPIWFWVRVIDWQQTEMKAPCSNKNINRKGPHTEKRQLTKEGYLFNSSDFFQGVLSPTPAQSICQQAAPKGHSFVLSNTLALCESSGWQL